MEDSSRSSSVSSSFSNFFSLEGSTIYDATETCDSLIARFEKCKLAEKQILCSEDISIQDNLRITDFHLQSLIPNNESANRNMFNQNVTMGSFQEGSSKNKHNEEKVVTHEVGVNTDSRFNYKAKNFRQMSGYPYFKYKKHLNQYRNFKRIYWDHNSFSKKQYKKFNNYKNYDQTNQFRNRWDSRMPQWQEARTERAFYFFSQLMKCFNERF